MNERNNKLELLGSAPIPKALMALGIPIMIGMLINALYNLVDAYFVSGLGKSQMGAISVVFPLGQVVVGLGLMFGNGAASYLSRLLGRGDKDTADKVASTALYSSILIGAIIILLSAIFLKPILVMLGATETIMPYALTYARIYVLSCVFNVFNVNLDVATISDLREVVAKWKAMGKTIIVAEHRLYYLMGVADRVVYMKDGRISKDMSVTDFANLPETQLQEMGLRSLHPSFATALPQVTVKDKTIQLVNFHLSYGKTEAVNIPQLVVPQGGIVGVLGNNGAGKTTFAKCLCGLEKSAQGFLRVGNDSLNAKQRLQKCYMVMQDVNHQLFTESVEDEILLSLSGENENADKQQAGEILENLNLLQFGKLHPMSLSGGQKQRVAIGSAIASDKEVLVFDEPTSGLDYHHMIEVARNLIALSKMGKTLFIITHDPELIAQCCNYFIFIEHGKIKWSGGWTDDNRHRLNDFFSVKL